MARRVHWVETHKEKKPLWVDDAVLPILWKAGFVTYPDRCAVNKAVEPKTCVVCDHRLPNRPKHCVCDRCVEELA